MKKLALILALSMCLNHSYAQPYGETDYANTSTLTSGVRTSINSNGFIMGGLFKDSIFVAGVKQMLIRINKTGIGGAYTGSNFQRIYSLAQVNNNNCALSRPLPGVDNCAGVSVIETTPGNNGEWYAMTGAYDGGCFFATLDGSGNTISTVLYPFPNYPTLILEKPHIVESKVTPQDFFICGNFDSSMYVMRINPTGGIVWSSFYNSGYLYPQAIIECPFTNDVVIAGWTLTPPSIGTNQDGFLLRLDPSNGNPNLYQTYNANTGNNCDQFFSIAPAFSQSNGGQGYLIGGRTDPNLSVNLGTGWMCKLDINGNVLWSTQLTPASDNMAGNITGVVERNNTVNNYENYGLCNTLTSSTYGVMVLKLDDNGVPYAVFNGGSDEYFYASPINARFWGNSLSDKIPPSTASNDVGLHVYADNNGNHFLIEAYYNGVAGCGELLPTIANYGAGPSTVNSPWINLYGSLSACADLLILNSTENFIPNQICTGTAIGGGSNARNLITDLPESKNSPGFSIFPNPSNGNFILQSDGRVDLKLTDKLGKIICEIHLTESSSSLSIKDLSEGIYFLSGQKDNLLINQKIIVTR